jgi:hypothetical protein
MYDVTKKTKPFNLRSREKRVIMNEGVIVVKESKFDCRLLKYDNDDNLL